jgi:sensor histidine kinase regulating citrate/malate metabolism
MASFKQLRYSNGNKTIYDLVEGAAKILNVTIDTPFELEIDEKLKMYRADHKTGLKNADLINIFINHFKNSVEANATKIQVFEENLKGHYLLLNIKDNGNGIPKEFVSDIFTPNKSTKNDFVGLRGNGLFLNQNLLKQFGGDIKLKKTEEGKGTEFVLKIPIEKIKQAQ